MNKIMIGLITGIAIGILIAPAKGSDTRKKLVDRFTDFTEDLSDNTDQLYSSGKNLVDTVKTDARELVKSVKDLGSDLS
jgi:gas vesicle protein